MSSRLLLLLLRAAHWTLRHSEQNADLEARDSQGFTALTLAANHNQVECLTALVDARANCDVPNNEPPLITASSAGSLEVVRELIRGKANLEMRDPLSFVRARASCSNLLTNNLCRRLCCARARKAI